MELYELRCRLRFDSGRTRGGALILDADLVHGVDGVVKASEVLAVGAVAWKAPGPADGEDELRAWESVLTGTANAVNSPAALPHHDARRFWALRLAKMLDTAVPGDTLDELLINHAGSTETRVRIVFRGEDEVASNVPFEAIAWRERRGADPPETTALVADNKRKVSILRVADCVELNVTPRLGARRPGVHAMRLVFPTGRGREFAGTVKAATSTLEGRGPDPFSKGHELEALIKDFDLAVIVGHGSGPSGLELDGGPPMDGEEIADAISSVSTVVLAMCGSAQPDGLQADPTRVVARRGGALTIGFQGNEVSEDHVSRFLESIAEKLRDPFAREVADKPVGLAAWESAISAGRQDIGDGAVVPVVYVHPALLLGATSRPGPVVQRLNPRRPSQSPRRRLDPVEPIVETVWCVPGQLVFATVTEGGPVRVPLPVDAGLRINVALLAEQDSRSSRGHGPISSGLVADVLRRWGLAGELQLDVTASDALVPPKLRGYVDSWARKSAELAALIRAIGQLSNSPVPPPVTELLDRTVKEDGGTHGPDLAFISARDGRVMRGAERNQSWCVTPNTAAPRTGWGSSAILSACQAGKPESLTTLVEGLTDPSWIDARLHEQSRHLLQPLASTSYSLRQVLGNRGPTVVLPGAATVTSMPAAPWPAQAAELVESANY